MSSMQKSAYLAPTISSVFPHSCFLFWRSSKYKLPKCQIMLLAASMHDSEWLYGECSARGPRWPLHNPKKKHCGSLIYHTNHGLAEGAESLGSVMFVPQAMDGTEDHKYDAFAPRQLCPHRKHRA